MKITTMRSMLVAADVLLVGALGWVVSEGMKERNNVNPSVEAFTADVRKQLDAQKPAAAAASKGRDYGANIDRANLSGRVDKPVVEAPTAPPPPTSAKPPLETLIRVVGIQTGPGDPPSIAYLVREDGSGAPLKPEDVAKEIPFFYERQIIEWAAGAVIKRIEPDKVIFDYDGKEAILSYKPPKAAPGGAPAGGSTRAAALPPPNNDPRTWIVVGANNSPGNVDVTPTGISSLSSKGESALDGVRWSTEKLPDGKNGLRIDEIPPGNVLDTGGVKSGDVLHSVNGERMTTKAEVVDYVKRNPNLARYEVMFYRNGVLHRRVVNVKR